MWSHELATEAVDDARQWFWNGESIGTLGQIDPTFRSSWVNPGV
ncbi:MAG: hypothetical protein U0894_08580 [Pirellulales bacterium]